jgi:putative ABC transport system permease protein
MLSLVPFALRNLIRRNRSRTALMVLTVAAATLVFCTVMVVPYVIRKVAHLADQSPRLVVTNRASVRYGLPETYYDKIVKLPGVVAVNRMVWFVGVYDDPRHQFPTIALDADNVNVMWPEYGLDDHIMNEFRSSKDAAVVGAATMHRFGWHVGQLVALKSQVYPLTLTFRIAGVYSRGPDLSVFMFRRDYLDEALHNPGRVDLMFVRCASVAATSRVSAMIDEMFRNSDAETRTATEKAFMNDFIGRFHSIATIVEAIGVFAVIALGLAVLNATAMTLRERRGELAVLRSLGFVGNQILASLAIEAVMVALAGGILGMIAADAVLGWIRGSVPALGPILSFGLPRPLMAAGISVALAIAILAAVAPAVATLRASLAQAMRHV